MGNSIYLDCSGLRDIRVNGNDIPGSIQIDGFDFLQRFENIVDKMTAPQLIEIKDNDANPVEVDRIKLSVKLVKLQVEIRRIFSDSKTMRELTGEAKELLNRTELQISEQIKRLNK